MYKPALVFILSTVFVLNLSAQDTWNRYAWGTPQREGFAVLLPTVPSQVSSENGEQGIEGEISRGSNFVPLEKLIFFNVTFKDGVSKEEYDRQVEKWMNLVGATGGDGIGSGGGLTAREKAETEREVNLNRKTRKVLVCGFQGIEFGNSSSVQQFFLVEGRLYHIWVTGAGAAHPEAARFLKSFTLVSPWERWTGMRMNESFEDLIIAAGSRVTFESSVCKNIGLARPKNLAVNRARNSPLRFFLKPSPTYPEESKKNQIQGSVKLKVTFLKNGTVGEIRVLEGINKEMDESAIRAAKRIKFEPQQKGGKYVTVTKTVVYNFALY